MTASQNNAGLRESASVSPSNLARRRALQLGGSLALLSMPAIKLLAATPIRIGYVSPQSGPLAAFAEADAFVMQQVMKAVAGGVRVGGATQPVEIIYKDSQSNSNRAADATAELIFKDKVDLVVAAATPATTN
ncbi:MAG: ABC transporter substrate-binding protein, partial [Proteobacteria bacterium]|nr:ABC transporter substrate-binding protein [Pseudomonadota bacterium]